MKINKHGLMNMYAPSTTRYQDMHYRRCGSSGILLPAFSLGLWHNFGHTNNFENARNIIKTAFDCGITHFDLANNYGPPYGSAEENFGRIMQSDMKAWRDELLIATKAGYDMWPGPYGNWGSKKYLFASLHQSLKRMQLDYVDIFYHHRPDPLTPLEETMAALDLVVRQGKALYVGLSNYQPAEAKKAFAILNELGTPCLVHQPKYSLLERWVEKELLDVLQEEAVGCIAFSPLAQGLLTGKYLNGIPGDSRIKTSGKFLNEQHLTEETLEKIRNLDELARNRNQTLAQMSLAWLLKDTRVTSVLLGASTPHQVVDAVKSLDNLRFDAKELKQIDDIVQTKTI